MIGLLIGSLLGCTPEVECSEEVACGFGEVCIEGACQARSCATSAQCGMEQTCKNGACVEGCAEDGDCYPGDRCDSELGTCTAGLCSDSHIDCAFGEFCSGVTGECYDAAGYYCKSCVNDTDCGGNGNLCLDLGYASSNFCGVTCTVESDCPSGYTCLPVGDGSGNIVTYQCATYCWLYDGDGRRPSAPGQSPLAPRTTP